MEIQKKLTKIIRMKNELAITFIEKNKILQTRIILLKNRERKKNVTLRAIIVAKTSITVIMIFVTIMKINIPYQE